MRPELLPQLHARDRRQSLLISLLARRAAADEKAAAAIVFVIAVEVGNAPDLPGPRIAAAVKFPVDHDACAYARTEGDANHVAVSVRLAETADASAKQLQSLFTETGTPNRFSKHSLRCTSRQEGMPTTS